MQDIIYRRELDASYMVIREGQAGDSFTERMLKGNGPKELLPMLISPFEDDYEYAYNISGMQSLLSMYEKKPMTAGDMRVLFSAIYRICCELEEYLLEPDKLYLEPEFIFWDRDRWRFCMYPARSLGLFEQLQGLTRFILKKAEHDGAQSERLAYELFRVCHEDNCSFAQIREIMELGTSLAVGGTEPEAHTGDRALSGEAVPVFGGTSAEKRGRRERRLFWKKGD